MSSNPDCPNHWLACLDGVTWSILDNEGCDHATSESPSRADMLVQTCWLMVTEREGHIILLGTQVQAGGLCCPPRRSPAAGVYSPLLSPLLVLRWASVLSPSYWAGGPVPCGLCSCLCSPMTLGSNSTEAYRLVLGPQADWPSRVPALIHISWEFSSKIYCLLPDRTSLSSTTAAIPELQLVCSLLITREWLCHLHRIENQTRQERTGFSKG